MAWNSAPLACEGCGRELPKTTRNYYGYSYETRPRSDAKYCSSACRQKAYRQRKKDEKRRAIVNAELPGQLAIVPTEPERAEAGALGLILPTQRPASRSRRRALQLARSRRPQRKRPRPAQAGRGLFFVLKILSTKSERYR